MHIAFVSLGYAPQRSSGLDLGSERVVSTLLQAGHQVTVIAAQRGPLIETHQHPGLRIRRIPLGRSNWIGYAACVAQLLQRLRQQHRVDVVHFSEVHFAYAYRGPYVAFLHHSFRQRLSTLGAWRARQLPRLAYYTLARRLAEQPALKRAAGLLAVSSTNRDEFVSSYGLAPQRVALTPYGIDTGFFHPATAAASAALRARLGLSPHEPVIFFAGFVTPRKGLDYLARALVLMRPQPRLLIAGRWTEGYRAHFLKLLGPAAERLVELGFVPDADLPGYYALADVYVSPSLMEGFGLPVAEALACQTPVVAAGVGSVPEVLGPGGLLVAPGDVVALAAAVSELLADRQRARLLGQAGRQHILRNFSVDVMRSAILAAYQRFLGVE